MIPVFRLPDKFLLKYLRSTGGEGDVDSYPDTAEDKAVIRMKDINNEEDWIELPKFKEKITPEKIKQHMKKRGYT